MLRMVFKVVFLTLQSILGEVKVFYFSARSRVFVTYICFSALLATTLFINLF